MVIKMNPKARKELKAKAHKLKPIVLIGNNGVTEAVIKEINRALEDHELIKIRIHSSDRDERRAALTQICETVSADLVQVIGNIGVLYRKNKE